MHPPVPPAAWAAEGARVAGELADVAAAVIVGMPGCHASRFSERGLGSL